MFKPSASRQTLGLTLSGVQSAGREKLLERTPSAANEMMVECMTGIKKARHENPGH